MTSVLLLVVVVLVVVVLGASPSYAWVVGTTSCLSPPARTTRRSSSTATTTTATSSSSTTSTTALFNIPPPSTQDKVAFQEYANKQSPPSSFYELQQDCIRSAQLAIDDGLTLLEVEFPPLPANVLEMDDVSAYDVASANLQLAIDFARGMIAAGRGRGRGDGDDDDDGVGEKKNSDRIQNVAIVLPDEDEARIAIERYTGKKDQYIAPTVLVENGITVTSLRRSDEQDDRLLKVRT